MVLRLDPEPVVPCEAVADDEAAQNVVRANDADYAQREEGESDAEGEKRLVVDQPAVSCAALKTSLVSLLLLGKAQDLARGVADDRADDAG